MRATTKARRASRSRTPRDTGSRSRSEVGIAEAAGHRIFTTTVASVYPLYLAKVRRRVGPGTSSTRRSVGSPDTTSPSSLGTSPRARRSPTLRRSPAEPRREAHHGRDLRGRRGDRRPAHAADPLPRQARGQAREGPPIGEGPAFGGFGRPSTRGRSCRHGGDPPGSCPGGWVSLTLIPAESGHLPPPARLLTLGLSLPGRHGPPEIHMPLLRGGSQRRALPAEGARSARRAPLRGSAAAIGLPWLVPHQVRWAGPHGADLGRDALSHRTPPEGRRPIRAARTSHPPT